MKIDAAAVDFVRRLAESLPEDSGYELSLLSPYPHSAEETAKAIHDIKATGIVRKVTKSYSENYFTAYVTFNNGVMTAIYSARENVCRRTQLGTTTQEVPDPDAPKVTVEVPVYEWQCDPILAGDDAE